MIREVKVVVFIVPLLIGGCAFFMQSTHTDKYSHELDFLIGVGTKENISNKYGPPNQKYVSDTQESWTYIILVPESDYSILDQTDGKYPELYDYLIINFDSKGIMQSWTLTVGPQQSF